MKKVKPVIARNACELASVLGLPVSTGREWEARTDLVELIVKLASKESLTHAEIAKRAGTSRTRVTSILNNNLHEVSTDLLIRILGALGYKIEFTVKKVRMVA